MPLHQEKMNPNDETFLPPPTRKVVKTIPSHNTVKSPNDEYPYRSGEQPVLKPWSDEGKCIPSITFIGSHVETGEIREIPEWHRIQELSEEIRKVSGISLWIQECFVRKGPCHDKQNKKVRNYHKI